jgi:hypothetical protein
MEIEKKNRTRRRGMWVYESEREDGEGFLPVKKQKGVDGPTNDCRGDWGGRETDRATEGLTTRAETSDKKRVGERQSSAAHTAESVRRRKKKDSPPEADNLVGEVGCDLSFPAKLLQPNGRRALDDLVLNGEKRVVRSEAMPATGASFRHGPASQGWSERFGVAYLLQLMLLLEG